MLLQGVRRKKPGGSVHAREDHCIQHGGVKPSSVPAEAGYGTGILRDGTGHLVYERYCYGPSQVEHEFGLQ